MRWMSLILVFLMGASASAFPINSIPLQARKASLTDGLPAILFQPAPPNSDPFNFNSIISLSNCSGSVVRLVNSRDSDAALLFTNGHCVEVGPFGRMLKPKEILSNTPVTRAVRILKETDGSRLASIETTRLIYATMLNTDMAIYELNKSFQYLKDTYGVQALTLSNQHPTVGQDVEIISGYWARGFRCAIDAFVHQLSEQGYEMYDSIRFTSSGCETYGGTSGSPIVAAGTRIMVGVNNTGNENGQMCTMNNPCEIDEQGNKVARKGASYGQQTYLVYTCLNGLGNFDTQVPGCELPH